MVAVNSALIIVPFFSALIVMPGAGLALEYPPVDCPVDAVAFLQREKIHGNLLVPFNYGSYALWELRGRMRVSMDGRYDLVYKPETYQRVDDFFAAKKDWYETLTHPTPDAVLVPATGMSTTSSASVPAGGNPGTTRTTPFSCRNKETARTKRWRVTF